VKDPLPSITVVVVSWEPGEELVKCITSIAAARERLPKPGLRVSLVVVDNGSASFPGDALAALVPDALVRVNPGNLGFGPAANQGARLASGDVVLFLNPDTEADGDPFTPLAQGFAAHQDAVALAPRLLEAPSPSGEAQGTFQLRHLPTRSQAARELLLLDKAFPQNPGLLHDRYAGLDRGRPFPVEQPAAAALAVRRSAFERIGGFDEAFCPAWFEDVDLCARLLRLGTVLYWPASRFVHAGGGAARRLGYDRFLPLYYRNAHRYWRKHHGAVGASFYRALVAVGMVLRLAVLPVRASVPRARGEAAHAYLRVLRGALGLDRSFHVPRSLRQAWTASARAARSGPVTR
jgi:N-acetylglucosaminyl-diphospho-decaprenol L-rhamnosyltransferase